jgi:hypothetical protein
MIGVWNILIETSQAYLSPKINFMQTKNLLRHTIIGGLLCLNVYALLQGIIYESVGGILLATAAMGTLAYCARLMKKLSDFDAAEEV